MKENDEHALDFALHLSRLCFGLGEFGLSVYGSKLSSPSACLIIARVSFELFPRFVQNLMLLLCRIHREISSAQKHDSK
jgi:hypothetical protein